MDNRPGAASAAPGFSLWKCANPWLNQTDKIDALASVLFFSVAKTVYLCYDEDI